MKITWNVKLVALATCRPYIANVCDIVVLYVPEGVVEISGTMTTTQLVV